MNEHLRGVPGVPCMFFAEFLTVAIALAALSAAVAVATATAATHFGLIFQF